MYFFLGHPVLLLLLKYSTNILVGNNEIVTWFAACSIYDLFGKEELSQTLVSNFLCLKKSNTQTAADQITVLCQHLTHHFLQGIIVTIILLGITFRVPSYNSYSFWLQLVKCVNIKEATNFLGSNNLHSTVPLFSSECQRQK